jgi:tetratricopeptide (TPR) repeat protein
MLLRRCTEFGRSGLLLLIVAALTGCAGGSAGLAPTNVDPESVPPGGEQQAVPAAVRTMFEQAAAVMAAGDYVEAEFRFKEFLLRYPDYPGAHVNLAIIHATQQDDAASRAALDAALALNPEHPSALNLLGQQLRRIGDFSGAEAAYLKAVTVSPDYALAHYNLGVLYELYLQRLDAALEHFEAYQALVGEDKQVEKWIADLRRRLAAAQRTANVAD